MPTIANIVIKKADGTTDVTYKAIQGAAGPNNPATFRNETVGTTVAQYPSLLVKASDNGARTARRIRVDFAWPTTSQDAGGNVQVTGRMSGEASVLIPLNQAPAVIKEQAYQFAHLIASTMVKASFDEGYAPRSA